MADEFEVLLTLQVGDHPIELQGRVNDDDTLKVGLSEHALGWLREQSIGSLAEAMQQLFDALGLSEKLAEFDIIETLKSVPGVSDAVKVVEDIASLPVYLTALAFETGVSLKIGIMVALDTTVGPVTFSRVGVTMTRDLTEPSDS